MILKDVKLMLNNGKRCVMRSGQADDSRKAAVYFRQIAQEDAFTEMMADEVPDVYEIRKMLQHFETAPREVMVLAWIRKQIIGCGMLKTVQPYCRMQHRCSIRIGVLPEYQQIGVATGLAQQLLRCAGKCDYEQIELEVMGKNIPAVSLCNKMGFSTYWIKEKAFKMGKGRYEKALLMEKKLDWLK